MIWLLGSSPDRGQSPVEWVEISYVRTSVPLKVSQLVLWASQLYLMANWLGLGAYQPGHGANKLGLWDSQQGLRAS